MPRPQSRRRFIGRYREEFAGAEESMEETAVRDADEEAGVLARFVTPPGDRPPPEPRVRTAAYRNLVLAGLT